MAEPLALAAGGVIVLGAAFLGGVTGFGYTLVATPLLLLVGFPLPFVVTANLALALVTRIPVAIRLGRDLAPGRLAGLVGGSVPGLWLGAVVLTAVAEATIRAAAGLVTMAAAALLARSASAPATAPIPGAPVAAGFAGGLLGAATSLNGIAPVLLLARDRASPRAFQANLAVYFVVSNAIGLALLLVEGAFAHDALPAFALWLPGSLVGNVAGTALAPRLPERGFRRLTLGLVFVAGAVTAATALL